MKVAAEERVQLLHRHIEFLEEAMPALQSHVEAEQELVLRQVGELIKENALTGDLAVQLWHQFRAAELFLDRLRGKMRTSRVVLTQGENAIKMKLAGKGGVQ